MMDKIGGDILQSDFVLESEFGIVPFSSNDFPRRAFSDGFSDLVFLLLDERGRLSMDEFSVC